MARMMLRSLYVWWKFRHIRNNPKVLGTILPNLQNRRTVNVEPTVDDEKLAASIVSAKVGSIAARSILRIVKAWDDAPGMMAMIKVVQKSMSEFAHLISAEALSAMHKIAKDAEHLTQAGLPVVINLEPAVKAAFALAHDLKRDVRKDFDQVDRANRTPYKLHLLETSEKAMSDLNYAVANAIRAHIASIAAPTTMSIPPLEKLLNAIAAAAAESMRVVVSTVEYMENSSPPSYESLNFLGEGRSQTLSHRADDDELRRC